jgi:poly(3-hydroxybutyrate) depolymerase
MSDGSQVRDRGRAGCSAWPGAVPRRHPLSSLLLWLFISVASSPAVGCHPPVRALAPTGGLQALAMPVSLPARSDTVNLLLYLPPEHGNGQLWPALLYLHGGSQRGTDLERLRSYGPPRLLAQGWEPPFILIAPQLPEGEIWSDAESLMRLIDGLIARYPIDPERLYATGMSMGGRGVWYLAFRHPERFAAIAPVAAFQPIPHWASSGRLRGVPVRAYHGDRDDLAPFAEAARMHEALRAAGGSSELEALPGRDHFIADVFEDPSLYRWLLRHRRETAPRTSGMRGAPRC